LTHEARDHDFEPEQEQHPEVPQHLPPPPLVIVGGMHDHEKQPEEQDEATGDDSES
jgi:hypothetical protein